MKITRIQRIRGYRIFRNFTWPSGLPDFGRFNLIYGWNGSGKTTLSDLFRQLQRNEPIADADVQFLVDGNTVSGSLLGTVTLPKIRVFNRDTVDRTVFENPDHELPPIYVLGEDNAEKQKKIEELKQDIAKATIGLASWSNKYTSAEAAYETFCSDHAQSIKNLLTTPGGGKYNNYNKSDFKQTAEKITSATSPIPKLVAAEREKLLMKKDGRPMEKLPLLSIQFPDHVGLTKRVQEMLARSVLSSALSELENNPAVAVWINQGLTLHTGENASKKCRFCDQILTDERLKLLQGHFNDEFRKFQGDIDSLITAVNSAKSSTSTIATKLPSKSSLYQHLTHEYESELRTLDAQLRLAEMYLHALHAALTAKKAEPFKTLDFLSFMTGRAPDDESTSTWEKVLQVILAGVTAFYSSFGQHTCEKINALIGAHNKHTDNFEREVVNARKSLEEDEVVDALAGFQAKRKAITDTRIELAATQRAIQDYQSQITTLEQAIRSHQKPADELNKEMAAYLGRDELCFVTQKTGYIITRNGYPATHLSEGERTAIAFMYFLKTLKDTGFDIKTGVVVIDDPVSSLDANSLYSAFGFMKARTYDANQLFVLTHNFSLFRQVRNWFNHLPGQKKKDITQHPARFYMIAATIDGGQRSATLGPLDPLLHEFESEYHYLFKKIYEEASRPAQANLEAYYSLPNIGRRLLEAFLAFRIPSSTGELFQKLEHIQFDVAKKNRILRFLHTHSHFDQIGDPEHDLSVLSETPAILKDLLDMMRETDNVHYDGMLDRVAQQAH